MKLEWACIIPPRAEAISGVSDFALKLEGLNLSLRMVCQWQLRGSVAVKPFAMMMVPNAIKSLVQ